MGEGGNLLRMFHPHSAAFASLLLVLLNICFSSGKKSSNPDLPSESEWGSIESIETSDTERIIAMSKAKAKAKKQMASHGLIQAGHGPLVHHEIVGGGANHTIDGGEGGEVEDVVAGNQPTKGKGAGAGKNETTEVEGDGIAGHGLKKTANAANKKKKGRH